MPPVFCRLFLFPRNVHRFLCSGWLKGDMMLFSPNSGETRFRVDSRPGAEHVTVAFLQIIVCH